MTYYSLAFNVSNSQRFFLQFQVRPHLELTFENILSHINTVYVLKTKPGVMEAEHQDVTQEFSDLGLKVSGTYISSALRTQSEC
jgi:Heme NO binding associated.